MLCCCETEKFKMGNVCIFIAWFENCTLLNSNSVWRITNHFLTKLYESGKTVAYYWTVSSCIRSEPEVTGVLCPSQVAWFLFRVERRRCWESCTIRQHRVPAWDGGAWGTARCRHPAVLSGPPARDPTTSVFHYNRAVSLDSILLNFPEKGTHWLGVGF